MVKINEKFSNINKVSNSSNNWIGFANLIKGFFLTLYIFKVLNKIPKNKN